ncbi:hypothetical protein [Acidicapsa ligni]|uniref:hypothetical protein n=1 Tax=Acidicapsa ligni TaxID=542300 RepID=UPI0021DF70BE|nr:hypothetical protein [Acidicapsa ligni]
MLTTALLLANAFALPQAAPPAQSQAQPATQSHTQSQAEAAATTLYMSDMGFTYGYPSGWELVDTKPLLPAAQSQAQANAADDPEKRGAACAQIGFLARHGSPGSVILSLSMPFECFGSRFTQDQLPGVGEGMSLGIKSNFDITTSIKNTYKLGKHDMWIERAKGASKGHPEAIYTIETACAILDRGMVCLLGMVKDDAALHLFEQGQVSLEGDPPSALVPANIFAGQP